MNGTVERIGFADIEASNLTATFGIVYTYCIKELDGELIKRAISLDDLHKGEFDKNLIASFIDDASKFTRLVFHYGNDRRFDVPFLRTRAVKWNLPFPGHKCMYVSDTYPILRNKFKLHSNRLETACDFFNIPAKKHKLNSEIWLNMITGNKRLMKKAIDYILIHNIEDVVSLEMLWKKISKFTQVGKTSI
jgi:DNA polymerase III epsilon subunit-like protein